MEIIFGLSALLNILSASALWVVWLRDREQVFGRDLALWYLSTALLLLAYPVWRNPIPVLHWLGYGLVVMGYALGHTFLLLGVRRFSVDRVPRPRLGYTLAGGFSLVYALVFLTANPFNTMGVLSLLVALTAGIYATSKLWSRGRIERSIGILIICATAASNLILAIGGEGSTALAASVVTVIRAGLAFAFVFAALNRSAAHGERMLLRFEQLSENSLQGIMVMDQRRFYYLNPAVVAMFGYSSKAQMLASDPWISTPEAEREPTRERFASAMRGHGGVMAELQATRVRRDGSTAFMRFTAWPVEWDGHPAMQVLVSDETQKRAAAMELEQAAQESRRIEEAHRQALVALNAALEQRVSERTRDLAQSNNSLAQANLRMEQTLETLRNTQAELVQREKLASLGRMVAGIAHELNTPIGIALTVGSTLRQQVLQLRQEVDNGQLKKSSLTEFLQQSGEGANMLESALHKAHALITNFRQVAKDHTEEPRTQFSVSTLIESLGVALQPAYEDGQIRLIVAVPGDVEMNGYPGHLTQVLTQLIDNARVHAFSAQAAGEIRVELAHRTGQVCISVCDNGVGIDADLRTKVFDPFFTTRLGGNVGLGLNTVYTTVTAKLGGHIALHSESGQGTRFEVQLPLRAPDVQRLH